MEYITTFEIEKILENNHPKIVLYAMADPTRHSVNNSLSCIYVRNNDGEFVSSYDHFDYPRSSFDSVVINNAYTLNIKNLKNMGIRVTNSVDLLYFNDVPEAPHLEHFYRVKIEENKNINRVIPVSIHAQHMSEVALKLDRPSNMDSRYKRMYHDIMPTVFSSIERRGVPVNDELFLDHYGYDKKDLVRESRVYTSYNLYTTTGRPSNTHGGINYAALNKTDGSRQAFQSDRMLVNIDFNSYHLHLICDKLNIQIPDDLHSWLGKQYFGVETLTNDQYEEAKKITFRNLYGYEMDENVKSFQLFQEIQNFQEDLWAQYQSCGYLLTDYDNHIVVDNPSKNKVFNYYIQALETETNVKQMYTLIKRGLTPILYTYDSMVFEITLDEVEFIRNTLKENLLYPYTTKVGHNLDF
jgi:hypothetical protein